MVMFYKSINFSRFLLLSALILFLGSMTTGCSQPDEADIPVFSENVKEHIETLASDEFEGRAPATPGGRKTVEYIENQFAKIGLKPAVGDSYRQAVPLMEITGRNFSELMITGENNSLSFSYLDDMIVNTSREVEEMNLQDSELVFVGYGVVAPEYDWDDYQAIDLEGKTVVILVNDPGFVLQQDELFTGRAMTYYGRWTYKFEEAARRGASGAIIVHQTAPAGYGWDVVRNSWSGAQYHLGENNGEPLLEVEGWVQEHVAEKIFEAAGWTLQEAMEEAVSPDFSPRSLDLTASVSFENSIRHSESYNVVGYIEGTGAPEESIVYMAHWDHLGKEETEEGVKIYNGAVDNATGTGGLIALAERFATLDQAPRRSVVFMAVTAEESGLLGSRYYTENPIFPLETTVGGINMDALNVYGATHDVTVIGYGNSEMDEYLRRHVFRQDRELVPEGSPEKGYYYRSDHFNFVRQGVPMIYANAGTDYIGEDEEYSKMVQEDLDGRYHDPSDVVHDLWRYDGIHQDLWLFYYIGMDLANTDDFPQWYEGTEFKELREASAHLREY